MIIIKVIILLRELEVQENKRKQIVSFSLFQVLPIASYLVRFNFLKCLENCHVCSLLCILSTLELDLAHSRRLIKICQMNDLVNE